MFSPLVEAALKGPPYEYVGFRGRIPDTRRAGPSGPPPS